MATISIVRKHAMTPKKAKEVAQKITQDLNKRFDLECMWTGNQVDFERPGVSGCMVVGKDKITLDVNLGWLLTPLKPLFEKEIYAQLDKLVGPA